MEKVVMATSSALLKYKDLFCSTEQMHTMKPCFGNPRFLHSSTLTKYMFCTHFSILLAYPPNKF